MRQCLVSLKKELQYLSGTILSGTTVAFEKITFLFCCFGTFIVIGCEISSTLLLFGVEVGVCTDLFVVLP